MKTIEEAAKEYAEKNKKARKSDFITKKDFKAGVNFAQTWIPVEEELPPCSDTDILLKGIDDRGIEGIVDVGYMHDSHDNTPYVENLIGLGGVLIKVTHWRPIEYK